MCHASNFVFVNAPLCVWLTAIYLTLDTALSSRLIEECSRLLKERRLWKTTNGNEQLSTRSQEYFFIKPDAPLSVRLHNDVSATIASLRAVKDVRLPGLIAEIYDKQMTDGICGLRDSPNGSHPDNTLLFSLLHSPKVNILSVWQLWYGTKSMTQFQL